MYLNLTHFCPSLVNTTSSFQQMSSGSELHMNITTTTKNIIFTGFSSFHLQKYFKNISQKRLILCVLQKNNKYQYTQCCI